MKRILSIAILALTLTSCSLVTECPCRHIVVVEKSYQRRQVTFKYQGITHSFGLSVEDMDKINVGDSITIYSTSWGTIDHYEIEER